ncbi:NUDIX hydrolase [Agrobacterium tumefaciens]|uniref:NUDIX hydrolase n=1 Tax=Agrobacterium tumefaciens TaxID=358 RepID=UPI003B9E0564
MIVNWHELRAEMMNVAEKAGVRGVKGKIEIAIGKLLGCDDSAFRRKENVDWKEENIVRRDITRFVNFVALENKFNHSAFAQFKDANWMQSWILRGHVRDLPLIRISDYGPDKRVVSQAIGSKPEHLLNERHGIVHQLLDISVTDVIYQKEEELAEENIEVLKEAKYIRVAAKTGKQGAAVLPIDIRTGAALLITQHRFPPDRFLTEIPRGFADQIDIDAKAVAIRELHEETGKKPIELKIGLKHYEPKMIFPIAEIYPDTGVLADKVGIFLAFVDRKTSPGSLKERKPGIENPVWLPIEKVYEAVKTGGPVAVELSRQDRPYPAGLFPIQTELDLGTLRVLDGFTVTAVLSARSHLINVFPHLLESFEAIDAKSLDTETLQRLEEVKKYRADG